jgi:uncharacterized protein YbaA (DUF1428 family)
VQIDGYVIPVPEEKRHEYLELAQWFDQAMIDHGAIEVFEGWELDVPDGTVTDFRKAVAAQDGESGVFSVVAGPDEAARNAARETVMSADRLKDMTLPFVGIPMFSGGYSPLVAKGR